MCKLFAGDFAEEHRPSYNALNGSDSPSHGLGLSSGASPSNGLGLSSGASLIGPFRALPLLEWVTKWVISCGLNGLID